MYYKLLADGIVVLHALNVAYVLLGPIWAWRVSWFRFVHLISLWWTFFVFAGGFYCPMTNFENSLRNHYNPAATYSTGFIIRYIGPMLWWDLTKPQVVGAMTAWTAFWTLAYAWLWARKKPAPRAGG